MTTAEWKQNLGDGEYEVRTCAWSPPGDHPVGCSLKMLIKDGKLVKVEGDPDNPVTHGSLCVRCLTLPEYIYHPQRIIHPMKRDRNDRGKDKWVEITYDEAYDIIEEKVNAIKEEWGAKAIVVLGGTGREATLYYPPLGYAVLQTPNVSSTLSGLSCYGPRCAVADFVLGAGYPELDYAAYFPDRYDHPGYEVPKYIMLWGKNPLMSNPDGFFGHSLIDLMKRGSKIITIDPRITWTAAHSAYHLQLRPGSDAALALGLLNVMINEDLYDHDFVDKWCFGFEDLKKRVQEYPPSEVAKLTWVPEEQIIAAARAFATSHPSSIMWGLALDEMPNGVQTAQCVLAMLAITGNIDVPGGVTIGASSSLMGKWRYETSTYVDPEEFQNSRLGLDQYPGSLISMLLSHPDVLLDTLESGEPYPIKMMWFNSTNPLANTAAVPQRWYSVFDTLEFNVVQDLFMTPTAMACCDLFLPLSTFAEHDGMVLPHFGRNTHYYGAMNKAIDVGDCRSDLEVCFELGKRLNPKAWPWETIPDFFSSLLEPYAGFDFERLREKGIYQPDYTYQKHEKGLLRSDKQPGFNTTTGKIELKCMIYKKWGEDPLPYFEEPPFSPFSTPELFEEYPLVLTTGSRDIVSFHSEHRQIDTLREIRRFPVFQVHPDTATEYGIEEGDWVGIENQFGKCRQKAHLTTTIDPRVVNAEHGWWFPEQDMEAPNLGGAFDVNVNNLLPHKTIGKLGYGAPYKCNICKIYKVEGMKG